jgi:Leucine-rich repeat (LRR) protein
MCAHDELTRFDPKIRRDKLNPPSSRGSNRAMRLIRNIRTLDEITGDINNYLLVIDFTKLDIEECAKRDKWATIAHLQFINVSKDMSNIVLPPNLKYLHIGGSIARYSESAPYIMPRLPVTLKMLHYGGHYVGELPEQLPPKLVYLYCDATKISRLPLLPKSLKILHCNTNKITWLPLIPRDMDELKINNLREYRGICRKIIIERNNGCINASIRLALSTIV